MQYNVAQLLKEPTGAARRYELVEDITAIDPDLEVLGPLVGKLQLMRTNSGVLVTGKLSTAVRSTCNRCLEPIAVPVRFELTESFRPLTEVESGRYLRPDEFEGDADDLEDEALLINEQHILDITEIVRQNIWLALPMYPGCNWGGPGPAQTWPICSTTWATCGCCVTMRRLQRRISWTRVGPHFSNCARLQSARTKSDGKSPDFMQHRFSQIGSTVFYGIDPQIT